MTRKQQIIDQGPRIGLNMDILEDKKGISFFLRARYADAVLAAGGQPVLIPPIDDADPTDSLKGLHGLILTGGDDLSPSLYGLKKRHEKEVPLHPQRERFDMELVRVAVAHRIPLLAICLGLQELCVAYEGRLHPYIPEAVPGALNHQPSDINSSHHALKVEPGTRLERILGPAPTVISSHRQAVSEPGLGLRVAARTADGIIEAVEGTGSNFLIGVQWHPEMMAEDPSQKELFRAFVEAAKTCSAL
ncbi:MAG: gamma-glutamyl-gamma-aminobutyrate hydrolase family protein [Planctomycetota bacterium]